MTVTVLVSFKEDWYTFVNPNISRMVLLLLIRLINWQIKAKTPVCFNQKNRLRWSDHFWSQRYRLLNARFDGDIFWTIMIIEPNKLMMTFLRIWLRKNGNRELLKVSVYSFLLSECTNEKHPFPWDFRVLYIDYGYELFSGGSALVEWRVSGRCASPRRAELNEPPLSLPTPSPSPQPLSPCRIKYLPLST